MLAALLLGAVIDRVGFLKVIVPVYTAAFAAIGSTVGPVIGGVLLQAGWDRRSLFIVAAIPALIAAALGLAVNRGGEIKASDGRNAF